VNGSIVVKKVMRCLPHRFDSKKNSIEEAKDLNTFAMDDLFGSLTAYEMRNEVKDTSKMEASFKVVEKEGTSSPHSESKEE